MKMLARMSVAATISIALTVSQSSAEVASEAEKEGLPFCFDEDPGVQTRLVPDGVNVNFGPFVFRACHEAPPDDPLGILVKFNPDWVPELSTDWALVALKYFYLRHVKPDWGFEASRDRRLTGTLWFDRRRFGGVEYDLYYPEEQSLPHPIYTVLIPDEASLAAAGYPPHMVGCWHFHTPHESERQPCFLSLGYEGGIASVSVSATCCPYAPLDPDIFPVLAGDVVRVLDTSRAAARLLDPSLAE